MVSRLGLPLILGAFVLLALAYSVIVPLGEAPDEAPHFAYIQYLILHRQMPQPVGEVVGESHQPPLYYFIEAIATAWIPQRGFDVIANPDFALDNPNTPNLLVHDSREAFPYREDVLAWHVARLLSIAMGAITVWATWRIASEIFPIDPWVALGAAAFVAFLPGYVFISAVVNNDNLITMLSSLGILQTVRLMRQPFNARDSAVLGVLLGLAVLTKLSGFVVWLFAAIVISVTAYRRRNLRAATIHLPLTFGIAAAMIAPWILRNLIDYRDPLGWSLILSSTPVRESPMRLRDWFTTGVGVYTSFWGRFGGALQLRLPSIVYAVLSIIGIASLAGWGRSPRGGNLTQSAKQILILFALFWTVMLAAYIRWVLTVLGADQARQLFPGIALLAILLVAGLARLFGTRLGFALIALNSALITLSVAVLGYLNCIYAPSL